MYSGITVGLFEVTHVERQPDFMSYTVQLNAPLVQHLKIGASVSIDGVCQTVVSIVEHDVTFHAIQETLHRTTLCQLHPGSQVSVERSLRYGDEVGGHEVAGHVIGTATILARHAAKNHIDLTLQCPAAWTKFIFPKGFIAIDGSSLTVDAVDASAGTFTLHLIPETLRLTQLGQKHVGARVNVELDQKTQAIVTTVERVLSTHRLT